MIVIPCFLTNMPGIGATNLRRKAPLYGKPVTDGPSLILCKYAVYFLSAAQHSYLSLPVQLILVPLCDGIRPGPEKGHPGAGYSLRPV